MIKSIVRLGRQPSLGLAELESLYGSEKLQPIGNFQAVIVDVDPCLLAFDRLGGSIKFCKMLVEIDTVHWGQIEKFLLQSAPAQSLLMPEGKMTLGLSVIGFDVNPPQVTATGLSMKKVIRRTGRPVRLVPNKELELSSSQVIHNKLVGPNGWEILIIKNGTKTILAQTIKEQDIASYTVRDRERPKRDSRVGMLPPKLAQIIINLAVGKIPANELKSICDIPADRGTLVPDLPGVVFDPFCGTGVILQEALLMGYGAYGTDLEARMVQFSESNLKWLNAFVPYKKTPILETADATNFKWLPKFTVVASEVYLGRPFTSRPDNEILHRTISDCNLIIKKFLKNIHSQLNSESRLCLAVPAWQTESNQFKHLPLLDSLEELGYNRLSFEHVKMNELIYYRESQIVARELLVLKRI